MYIPFNNFLIRTPLNSFNEFNGGDIDDIINDDLFQEAIYIASPTLHQELTKLLNGTAIDEKTKRHIYLSLNRYFSRMSTRCTPFGLFAGCTIGKISKTTSIIINKSVKTKTRLDMSYLCALSQELLKENEIRNKIKYYPNSTIFQIGNKYRYIETCNEKSKRIHRVSAVDYSCYLAKILESSRKGSTISNLMKLLTSRKVSADEAVSFIQELLASQVLVGELSPMVTGGDFLKHLIDILNKLDVNTEKRVILNSIQKLIYELDLRKNKSLELYKVIVDLINKLEVPYENQYLFQIDTIREAKCATIGEKIIEELKAAMLFLNKATIGSSQNETLVDFQQKFVERYADREVPLMEALDPDLGLGYPVKSNTEYYSPLLNNFKLPIKTTSQITYKSNSFFSILLKKTIECMSEKKMEISFTDEDVAGLKENWNDVPLTFCSTFQIIKTEKENTLIYLKSLGGNCGANMLARFAHADNMILELTKEIVSKEQQLKPNSLFAEIAHLPEHRVGNILSRPHFRDFEIAYLAHSNLPSQQQIYISDLFLVIKGDKLQLRSRKQNKEVIPCLTNAHNYHNSTIPVYRFLCDMQVQHSRGNLSFQWGSLAHEFTFLPRVRYKNTIISLATWRIMIKDIKYLFSIKDSDLIPKVRIWRLKIGLPECSLLIDGDNTLFVNWENNNSIQALFSIIKSRDLIKLSEFIFEPCSNIVTDIMGNTYLSECIVAFYNNKDENN